MSEVSPILRIEDKLQQLLRKWQQLRQENIALQQTVSRQQQSMEEQQQAIGELQHKINLLKIAATANKTEDGEDERKVLRQQINDYIREIDRCIALLSS